MNKRKEYIVTLKITYRGATATCFASSAEDARTAIETRIGDYDIDLSTAEMSDWTVTRVEENK